MNAQGPIRHVSKWHPGLTHAFTLYKQEAPAARGARAYADAGYQGIDRIYPKADFPYKITKK